jgi:hypothetical protein
MSRIEHRKFVSGNILHSVRGCKFGDATSGMVIVSSTEMSFVLMLSERMSDPLQGPTFQLQRKPTSGGPTVKSTLLIRYLPAIALTYSGIIGFGVEDARTPETV